MNLREEIEGILEQLWIDCNNTPTDGTIYDPIGILQDQATDQILQAFKEILPKAKTEIDMKSIPIPLGIKNKFYNGILKGFNFCLARIQERIGER